MDLNLQALIGMTYLIPIAITLRKIYSPCFDCPEPIAQAISRIEPVNVATHRCRQQKIN